ncbi:MAG: tRNA uridine-5-carboxymethylaminomethyl(34) synthesis GTPase MnmE [Oscillospiraceae bacterium]|nr:tRNA uridine-5-carboxymethylaminomethyl(34) synthesis GTPase MnmE [Oscillospiraceae bacterium]
MSQASDREGQSAAFDTIAAIATGSGLSAIGIIRISGPAALTVVDKVFTPLRGAAMSQRPDRQLVLGCLAAPGGALLDQCLATVSRGPNSYTGEDTAELQCHGSPVVLRLGLESLFAAGARQAQAGEFTKRAFINRRMDLTQAEAVIDLIDAETEQAAENAAAQLDGAIRRRTDGIYESLAAICSHYHAVIDYPDEDIEPFEMESYAHTLGEAEETLERLHATFRRGSVMKSGVPCAILGRPNAGKSSLLNAILGYERAIVTDIPGTTRDTVEERAILGGVLLRMTDTAGIRRTDDPVERLGVARARQAAEGAGLVLALFDGSAPETEEDREVLAAAEKAPRAVLLCNKSDLPQRWSPPGAIPISAKTGAGLEALEAAVAALFPAEASVPAGEILTNPRQAEAVARALDYVRAARQAMEGGFPPDAVLTEVEGALTALGELSGRSVREDVTNGIFARFCVGK